MSALQAMFQGMSRNTLKSDDAVQRRVTELTLNLEPVAQQQTEQNVMLGADAKRKLAMMAELAPDANDDRPKAPDPRMEKLKEQANAIAKEEKKRLIREAKRRQQNRK